MQVQRLALPPALPLWPAAQQSRSARPTRAQIQRISRIKLQVHDRSFEKLTSAVQERE